MEFCFVSCFNLCIFFIQWIRTDSLEGHKGAVIAVAALTVTGDVNGSRTVLATASADSTVRIWEREGSKGMCLSGYSVLYTKSRMHMVNIYKYIIRIFIHMYIHIYIYIYI